MQEPTAPPPPLNVGGGGLNNLETVHAEQLAVMAAVDSVLAPLAQLCLSKGIRIQAVEERLRVAFVAAARAAQPAEPPRRLTNRTTSRTTSPITNRTTSPTTNRTTSPITNRTTSPTTSPTTNRTTSRISAATGLTRREVDRLQSAPTVAAKAPASPITELFTRWLTEPTLRGADDKPRPLPRQGPAPSFESLAQSVTQDVHPRTLLGELCRLQLATLDPVTDEVKLLRDAFVPSGDWARMLTYVGDNVGDHFRAAVANVLQGGKQQLEQAIFADDMSAESLAEAEVVMTAQWRRLLTEVAPQLEKMIEKDRLQGRTQDQSMRIGLYTWSSAMPANPPPPLASNNPETFS